jgi:UMF1 family MFS transporter
MSKRSVFSWCIYDWASSAYVTTVATAVLPAYFAAVVVPEGGITIMGAKFTASSLWGYLMSATAFIMLLTGPILGAIADYSGNAKRFLAFCALGGGALASLLFFSGSGDVWQTILVFGGAHLLFIAGNVFYDSFLPHIAERGQLDKVSGRGFAYGYFGGGLQFGLALLIVAFHEELGLSQPQAARTAMAFAAIWWAGFALVPVFGLPSLPPLGPARRESLPARIKGYVRIGFGEVISTTRRAHKIPGLLLFLIAFLCYNDGIQTVIAMATIYGKEELGLATPALMGTLLMIQFVAVGGAWGFGRLAGKLGAKLALMLSLVVWCGVSVYAFFLVNATQYFILGAVVGLVMGGSQALSRSVFTRLIPKRHSGEFFGYFSVFKRLSSVGGPFFFALVTQLTGSSRLAIVSLLVFFVAGLLLLTRLRLQDNDQDEGSQKP